LFLGIGKGFLLVAGRNADDVGLNPNLEKMRPTLHRMIELTVHHASACTHALHIAGGDAAGVAHAVFVRQCTRHHVADDLHIAVAVRAKACAGGQCGLR
jgi:hypothetical protein